MGDENPMTALRLKDPSLITHHPSLLLKRLAEKPPHVVENLVQEG